MQIPCRLPNVANATPPIQCREFTRTRPRCLEPEGINSGLAGRSFKGYSDRCVPGSHGWMLAWVYVVDNPYFAQTGDDGTFSIGDVPPGEYTLAVWQEELGLTEMPVTVAANEVKQMSVELEEK